MAATLQLTVLTIAFLTSLFITTTIADSAMEASSLPFLSTPLISSPSPVASPPSTSPPPFLSPQSPELQSPMAVLEAILSNLGFQELSVAVPSLSDSAYYTWNGPSTIFAPTDDSIRSCSGSCSVPQLLREHIVPGIFTSDYLKKLAFGTKLETMSTGRCITVTTANARDGIGGIGNGTIVYIGGVEITQPDFFNNGLVVVHRLEGFISPLSPFSCNIERMNPMSFPSSQPDNINNNNNSDNDNDDLTTPQSLPPPSSPSPAIMRLMLKDAMLRLHNNGYSVLSLALRVKYPEIVNLQNMTVFALDDASIFSGGHGYLNNFRFHVVPNRMLMSADLLKLPTGTTLPTMDHGQTLMVTTSGSGGGQMRINYVRIKTPDVVYNLRIAVHSVFLPFPHLHPAAVEFGGIGGTGFDAAAVIADSAIFKSVEGVEKVAGKMGSSCVASEKGKGCGVAASATRQKEDSL